MNMTPKRRKASDVPADNLAAQTPGDAASEPPPWLRPLVEQIIRECAPTAPPPPRLIEFQELLKRVPLSARTVRDAMRRGWIPHIRLPNARRILFDFDAVRTAFRRFERGGLD